MNYMPQNNQIKAPLSDNMLTEHVTHLLKITQSLSQVLKQENQWLEERRPSEIKSLHEEKTRLAALYAKDLRIVRTHNSQLTKVDTALRRTLQTATEELQNLIQLNERLIGRLKSVSDGILQAISDEIEKRNQPLNAYGRNAMVGGKKKQPTSLALDAQI